MPCQSADDDRMPQTKQKVIEELTLASFYPPKKAAVPANSLTTVGQSREYLSSGYQHSAETGKSSDDRGVEEWGCPSTALWMGRGSDVARISGL